MVAYLEDLAHFDVHEIRSDQALRLGSLLTRHKRRQGLALNSQNPLTDIRMYATLALVNPKANSAVERL